MPELEKNRLYAVLSYRGDFSAWNWAFHVPDPSVFPIGAEGTLFRVVKSTGSTDRWEFEFVQRDVVTSDLVVAIVRLCDISFLGGYEDVVRDCLVPILKTVPIPPEVAPDEFSSKTWFLEAIVVLHDCGVPTCDPEDAWPLEREIQRFAFNAMDKYLQNKGGSLLS